MIKIIADSSCNLTQEVIKSQDIEIVPAILTMEEKTYKDYVDISPSEFFEKLPTLKNLPASKEPDVQSFYDVYTEQVKKGFTELIVFTVSAKLSETYKAAMIAKEMFLKNGKTKDAKIHIVDSKAVSHGMGYMLMQVAKMNQQGASTKEIIQFSENCKDKIKQFFTVADLNNLVRTGRLSMPAALLGKLFGLEHIMSINKGMLEMAEKANGRKNVMQYLVDEYKKDADEITSEFVIISYTSDLKYANEFKEEFIKQTGCNKKIYMMQMGTTIGAYVGLGSIGLFFMGK